MVLGRKVEDMGVLKRVFDITRGGVRTSGFCEEVLRHAWDGTFSHAGTQTGTSPGAADRNGFVCLTSKTLQP